jgi:hypothetical protein
MARTLLDRIMFVWFQTFAVLLCYWQIAVWADPRDDYASPYLPCVYMATLATPALVLLGRLADRLPAQPIGETT